MKGFPWHEGIIEDNNAARAEGGQVWPQISVRPLTFQMNLREPFTFNMAPAFAALMDASTEHAPRRVPRSRRGARRRSRTSRPRR